MTGSEQGKKMGERWTKQVQMLRYAAKTIDGQHYGFAGSLRELADELAAAPPSQVGQGLSEADREALLRAAIVCSNPHNWVAQPNVAGRLRKFAASPSSSELQERLNEFDAWLSFRGEFHEVLVAFRNAFGTDKSGHAAVIEAATIPPQPPAPGLLEKLEVEVERLRNVVWAFGPTVNELCADAADRLQAILDSERSGSE